MYRCMCVYAYQPTRWARNHSQPMKNLVRGFWFSILFLEIYAPAAHTHIHKYLYMHAVGLVLFGICFQCSRAQSLSNACARYKAAEYITVSQREREYTPFRIVCARSNHGALHYTSTHNYTYTHRHSGVELALEVALAHVIASIKQQQQDDLWQPFPALKWQQKQ